METWCKVLESADVRWEIIADYKRRYSQVRAQLEGYNNFVTQHLPGIVSEKSDIVVEAKVGSVREKHKVQFGGVTIVSGVQSMLIISPLLSSYANDLLPSLFCFFVLLSAPQLPPNHKEDTGEIVQTTPHMCRQRKLTYRNPVVTNLTHTLLRYAKLVGVVAATSRIPVAYPPYNKIIVRGIYRTVQLSESSGDEHVGDSDGLDSDCEDACSSERVRLYALPSDDESEEDTWITMRMCTDPKIEHALGGFLHPGASNPIAEGTVVVAVGYLVALRTDPFGYVLESRLENVTAVVPADGDMAATLCDEYPDPPRGGHVIVKRTVDRLQEVPLFKIPTMVRSRACALYKSHKHDPHECVYDEGGYFIVDGHDKVLLSQRKLRTNTPFCFPGKQQSKFAYVIEVRSCGRGKWRSTSTLKIGVTRNNPMEIYCMIPFVVKGSAPLECPLVCVLRMLGCASRDDMMAILFPEGINEDPLLRQMLERALNHPLEDLSAGEVLLWMGREGTKEKEPDKQRNYMDHIRRNEFLPHLGATLDAHHMRKKALYVGMMCRRLVAVREGLEYESNRDHQANRRLDGPGPLLAFLFRQLFRNHLKSFRAQLMRAVQAGKYVNLESFINFKKITSSIRYHFSTGNWSLQKNVNMGVVQQMSRMSVDATRSHLNRTSTPINRDGKATGPRALLPAVWGLLCPAESPEGPGCGLISNMAIMTHVTLYQDPTHMEPVLFRLGVVPFSPGDAYPGALTPVFMNGDITGHVADPDDLVAALRSHRRSLSLSFETSVVRRRRGIFVNLDPGRCLRPLLVAEALGRVPSVIARARRAYENLFDALLREGCLEYLDKEEEESWAVVAVDPRTLLNAAADYTHLEIDPNTIFGATVCQIPFPGRNQSPRNMYQAAMGKQSVSGVPTTSFATRLDTHMHVLCHPTYPVCTTRYGRLDSVREMPGGETCLVAIMCDSGANQEDSLIMNEAAIKRGKFFSVKYHTYRDAITSRSEEEYFGRPPEDAVGLRGQTNYDLLGEDGIVPTGTYVQTNDAIIGKTVLVNDFDDAGNPVVRLRDRSTILKSNEKGYVDRVVHYKDSSGKDAVAIRIATLRVPEVGDKFSSRHGQKGTIGRREKPENMPFCALTGEIPDILVNPQAMPSRMTIGHMVETLLSKAGVVEGRMGDGTAFSGVSIETIGDHLERAGWHRKGRATFYSGRRGTPLECEVFLGVTYYQKLKHMVSDKIHSRSTGPIQTLTRQPLDGRSRYGGLRFGEMERDSCIGHGASHFLLDRTCLNSDACVVHICRRCGLMADPPKSTRFGESVAGRRPLCRNCESSNTVVPVQMPYSAKLLWQELFSLHYVMRFRLAQKDEPPTAMHRIQDREMDEEVV